jgi:hypothetical protein
LTLGTGLKSPREVYFGSAANPNRPAAILAISEQDMALYGRYASAAVGVFERHNLRRQRRPTAWKLPNPFRNIRVSLNLEDKVREIGCILLVLE